MDNKYIHTTEKENIQIVTLNRPQKKNAINNELIKDLTDVFFQASKNESVKAVILTGAGDTFCSGADLEYLKQISNYSIEENQTDSHNLLRMYLSIYEIRKPVIAMVNGAALAGGCGLATVCDFVIASEQKAKFGYPEVKIGFIPAIVLIFLIKRVGEGRARELVLSGKLINSLEALKIGLINEVVNDNDLENYTYNFTKKLLELNSGVAMGLCKEMFTQYGNYNVKQALEYAANMNAFTRMTPDCRKGINGFLNKEKIKW